jgi:aminoglycoside phosphotransferase (APT) family kinase protein
MTDVGALITTRLEALTGGNVSIERVVPLVGGACQDNYRVDLEVRSGVHAGRHRMVLRSDAKRSLPGSLGRKDEFSVIETSARRGVKTPRAVFLLPSLLREGADAYLMDFADGEAIGAKILRDPALEGARKKLPGELAEALAKIHTITPENAPELDLPLRATPKDRDPAELAIESQSEALDQLPETHPGLELALCWLKSHMPKNHEVTLVHGDFRTGNFLVTPDGLSGILDWEFAHWGSPMDDIAWLCVRDWRFGNLKAPAGGLATRRTFYDAYAKASGRTVDPAGVHFWEIMGNVRWAIGAVVQGLRYVESGEADLELPAIARRAVEMEYEALRLIEHGA